MSKNNNVISTSGKQSNMNNTQLRLMLWFKAISFKINIKKRQFKGMKWSNRPRPRIGWGVCIRLNSPPKINNQLSIIYLWSFIWKEGRTIILIYVNRFAIDRKFFKEQSRNKLKRYIFNPI